MIQRIQTLFLLAAAILSFIIIINPVSEMRLIDKSQVKFTSFRIKSVNEPVKTYLYTYPIGVIAIVSTLFSLLAIFLFHKRIIQMRLCVYNILINIALLLIMFFYYFKIRNDTFNQFSIVSHSFTYTVIFPIVIIILLFQAFRTIRRDELLIKSYNRLR